MWKGVDVILAVLELGNTLLVTNVIVKSRVQPKKYVMNPKLLDSNPRS